jgi:cold shock CspA family protein
MARPILSSKRDNEKKKVERRAEKQKRKETRKASGTNSMDDMIAYADHYGNISATPPGAYDSRQSANDNNSGADNNDRQSALKNIKGRVEHINQEKGYGFIKDIAKTDKYYFHFSNTSDKLLVNDIVLLDLEHGRKGLNAVNVRKLNE